MRLLRQHGFPSKCIITVPMCFRELLVWREHGCVHADNTNGDSASDDPRDHYDSWTCLDEGCYAYHDQLCACGARSWIRAVRVAKCGRGFALANSCGDSGLFTTTTRLYFVRLLYVHEVSPGWNPVGAVPSSRVTDASVRDGTRSFFFRSQLQIFWRACVERIAFGGLVGFLVAHSFLLELALLIAALGLSVFWLRRLQVRRRVCTLSFWILEDVTVEVHRGRSIGVVAGFFLGWWLACFPYFR